MMTEKENFITAMEGGQPEHTTCMWCGGQIMIPSVVANTPPFGAPEGYDWWGVHWTATENTGWMFTPTVGKPHVLTDITKWREQVKFPDISNIDWEAAAKQDLANIDPNKAIDSYGLSNGIFERFHFLMGFEEAMCAMIEEPEEVKALLEAITDLYVEIIEKIGQYYKPDYFTFLDDYTHQNGSFLSPQMFDYLIAPSLKRIHDAVEDNGMKFIMHCCGKVEELIDRMYAIGIRRFDPVQPCNDVERILKEYPDISIIGGLDLMGVIDNPYCSEDDYRKEVDRCIDTYGKYGRYVLYCCSVSMYNPEEYAPGKKIGIIIDETMKHRAIQTA